MMAATSSGLLLVVQKLVHLWFIDRNVKGHGPQKVKHDPRTKEEGQQSEDQIYLKQTYG